VDKKFKELYHGDFDIEPLHSCPNSMTSKHVKAEKIGKNKNKPDTCKFCGRLWSDIKWMKNN